MGRLVLHTGSTSSKKGSEHDFTVAGNGKQVRDVLHVDDLVRLYVERATSCGVKVGDQVFNIGGGMAHSLSILELLAYLEQLLDIQLRPRHLPPRASDQKIFVANNAKAIHLLKWAPQTSASKGIQQMVQWLRNEGVL